MDEGDVRINIYDSDGGVDDEQEYYDPTQRYFSTARRLSSYSRVLFRLIKKFIWWPEGLE
ncbi:hypothetical protein TSUD_346690 [Trifolium subterraneum]|nr:hypothetical protein TSUD_346690 [Trifolium subterraneum]